MEEALYDVPLYREFAGRDGGMVRLPDESTILRFRHLLELLRSLGRGVDISIQRSSFVTQ
jgi:IS5 family transposase